MRLVGLARSVLLDIATFARLVARVEATRHVTQVAVGVSLNILRHIVIWIDFLALVSIGHGPSPSKGEQHMGMGSSSTNCRIAAFTDDVHLL
jgi:hypothetical protein